MEHVQEALHRAAHDLFDQDVTVELTRTDEQSGDYATNIATQLAGRVHQPPHHIATYLYELAQAFNRFYEQAKVIGDPRETVRLRLVTLYADTLRDGLSLLGITAPEQM
jgi:arginyl-tRNA synthetase